MGSGAGARAGTGRDPGNCSRGVPRGRGVPRETGTPTRSWRDLAMASPSASSSPGRTSRKGSQSECLADRCFVVRQPAAERLRPGLRVRLPVLEKGRMARGNLSLDEPAKPVLVLLDGRDETRSIRAVDLVGVHEQPQSLQRPTAPGVADVLLRP